MRRAAIVIALTVIGLYLVLSFKSSPLPRNAASATATVPARRLRSLQAALDRAHA